MNKNKIVFTFATAEVNFIGQIFIKITELLTGKLKLKKLYDEYLSENRPPELFWDDAVDKLNLNLITNFQDGSYIPKKGKLIVIANHAFGVADGVSICSAISKVRHDYKMITHKVVIVEDYVLISQAMKELVNSFENFNVLYLCRNGKELVTKLKTPKNVPNIILMDVNMPIMDGIETTQYLKDNFPDIKVIALSVDENDETIIKMLKAGAKGYLLKDVEKQTLEYALEEVVKAGFYHTKSVTDILISSLNPIWALIVFAF